MRKKKKSHWEHAVIRLLRHNQPARVISAVLWHPWTLANKLMRRSYAFRSPGACLRRWFQTTHQCTLIWSLACNWLFQLCNPYVWYVSAELGDYSSEEAARSFAFTQRQSIMVTKSQSIQFLVRFSFHIPAYIWWMFRLRVRRSSRRRHICQRARRLRHQLCRWRR